MPPPRSNWRSTRWTGTRRRRPWRQARQHWQRHRRFLCAVLSHDELDGIEQGFAELRAYSAVGDAAELRSRCEVLLLQLQHIAQLDAPYAENFLTCPVWI